MKCGDMEVPDSPPRTRCACVPATRGSVSVFTCHVRVCVPLPLEPAFRSHTPCACVCDSDS
jgi:hypothetical protein